MRRERRESIQLDQARAKALFGPVIDLGLALFGSNLNCKAVRGFARLDHLSVISGPDVYDEYKNPGGTQRMLDPARKEAIYEYALGFEKSKPLTGARAFPEVLLNVRDRLPVELYDPTDASRELAINDILEASEQRIIGVRVHLDRLEFPREEFEPRISRIDGNHRLSGMDEHLLNQDGGLTTPPALVPIVPFALFLDLTTLEERRIFNVVNSKQKNVEPALLETQKLDLLTEDEKRSPEHIASFIARRLSEPGHAFEKMVFKGGSRAGAKAEGLKLALKSSTLASAVRTQLNSRKPISLRLLEKDPDELFWYVDNYWKAVRETFPKAWHDYDKYILFQTIGLLAFAKYWGEIIVDVVRTTGGRVEEYMAYLAALKDMDLQRTSEAYRGVAGAGGAEKVFDMLNARRSELDEAIEKSRIKRVGVDSGNWKGALLDGDSAESVD